MCSLKIIGFMFFFFFCLVFFPPCFKDVGLGASVFGATRNLVYKPKGQEKEALALRNADTGNVLH